MVAFIATRGSGAAAQSSSFTVSCTSSSGGAPGNMMVLALAINESGSTTPTVASISVPSGETNAWVRLGRQDGNSGIGTAACHSELWAIAVGKPSAWGFSSVTVTLSGADGSAGAQYSLHEFSAGSSPSGAYGAAGDSTGATGRCAVTSSASINSGDLALGCFASSTTNGIDNDTSNTAGGTWMTIVRGSDPTLAFGYKVTTASGPQTYDPQLSVATGANANLVVAVPSPPAGSIYMVI